MGLEIVDLDLAELAGESDLLLRREGPLAGEEQDAVRVKRLGDRGDGGGVERLRDVDAGNLGADPGGDLFDLHARHPLLPASITDRGGAVRRRELRPG